MAKKVENWDFEHNGVVGKYLDRIDIFVLLDLIGHPDTSFTKYIFKPSTGDWYDRLVTIERNLRLALGLGSMSGKTIFNDSSTNSQIEDDHIPFLRRGVPILHLIHAPFPETWHTVADDFSSLDHRRISDITKILRVFVAEYLHLKAKDEALEQASTLEELYSKFRSK